MFSLYIHIPFCLRKCNYCNFNSIPCPTPPEDDYITALINELKFYLSKNEWKNRKIHTIYLGGGTPSLFSGQGIQHLLEEIYNLCDTSHTQEITIECNPCTLTEEKLNYYKTAQINRLSLGSQSFNPETLKILGRLHKVEDTIRCVETAKKIGFNNISLDLIYGIPEQTFEDLQSDLRDTININPQHITAYCLSNEEHTPFERMVRENKITLLKEDIVAEMMNYISDELVKNSYQHYEISNFAKEGFQSKHNSAYWNQIDYLGLGAGAHSFTKKIGEYGKRWSNVTNPIDYIKNSQTPEKQIDFLEILTKENAKTEFFMLNLRKANGFRIEDFENQFNEPFLEKYQSIINELLNENLITFNNNALALSKNGLLFADTIIEKFIL